MLKMPYMKFYHNDWRNEIGLMLCSLSAQAVWLHICGFAWQTQGVLELTIEDLASCISKPLNEVENAVKELESRGVFSRNSDGKIYSRRLVREYEISMVKSDCGKKGGAKRKQNASKTKANTQAKLKQNCELLNFCTSEHMNSETMNTNSSTERRNIGETQTESSECAEIGSPQPPCGTSGEAITENRNAAPPRDDLAPDAAYTRPAPRKARGEAVIENDEGFVEFWQSYPRHEDKAAARKAWIKVTQKAPKGERITPEEIMEAMRIQKERGWFDRETRYIPYPERYLSHRRWEDIPAVAAAKTAPAFSVPFASPEPVEMQTSPIWLDLLGLPHDATKAQVREAQLALERGELN